MGKRKKIILMDDALTVENEGGSIYETIAWELTHEIYQPYLILTAKFFEHIMENKEINFNKYKNDSKFLSDIRHLTENKKELQKFIKKYLNFDKLELTYVDIKNIENPTVQDLKDIEKDENILQAELLCFDSYRYNKLHCGFKAKANLKEGENPVWKFSTTGNFKFCSNCGQIGHSNCNHKEKVFNENGEINYPYEDFRKVSMIAQTKKEIVKMPPKEEIEKILSAALKKTEIEKKKDKNKKRTMYRILGI